MPQPTNLCNKSKKKVATSNGRIPAYNNAFAFRHNPKSKKTASILASPIQYCCRRCHDKLVWRKTYRKYKPLTQPTTCNLCNKRNITAAYHTVCDNCSVSHPKAMALLQEWNQNKKTSSTNRKTSNSVSSTKIDSVNDQVDDMTTSFEKNMTIMEDVSEQDSQQNQEQKQQQQEQEKIDDVTESHTSLTTTSTRRHHLIHKRVCTVCFKQPALPDDDTGNADDGGDDDEIDNRPLKLRQLKSLQRQREKQQQEEEQRRKKKSPNTDVTVQVDNDDYKNGEDDSDDNDDEGEYEDEHDDDEEEEEEDHDQYDYRTNNSTNSNEELNQKHSTTAASTLDFDNDDDMNDPFLQAIGGAQNLLVGEAYQKKLMEQTVKRF